MARALAVLILIASATPVLATAVLATPVLAQEEPPPEGTGETAETEGETEGETDDAAEEEAEAEAPTIPIEVPGDILGEALEQTEGDEGPGPAPEEEEPESAIHVTPPEPPSIVPDVNDEPLVPAQSIPPDRPLTDPPSMVEEPGQSLGMANIPTVDVDEDDESRQPVRAWSLAVAGGVSILLLEDTDPEDLDAPIVTSGESPSELYLVRIEQRIEWEDPEFGGIRLGLGIAEMFNDAQFIFQAGPRIGIGVAFCDEPTVRCTGTLYVQPGISLSNLYGPSFDLHAAIEGRFLIMNGLELSVGGAFSRVANISLAHIQGGLGVQF